MRHGNNMPKPEEVIHFSIQFTDTDEIKIRPTVILFKELETLLQSFTLNCQHMRHT